MSKRSFRGRTPATNADVFFGDTGIQGRQAERKERQLCRQVQEAISEALASLHDDILSEVWVCSVEPAPDASRLAILVRTSKDAPIEIVKERLTKIAGYLRTEVAAAITRKRVPVLTFEVFPPEAPL